MPKIVRAAFVTASVLLAGCSAESTAQRGVLAPAVVMAWPSIQESALRDIDYREQAGFIGPTVAAELRERVRIFGEAVDELER